MKVLRLISNLDPAHGGPPVSAVNSAIAATRQGIETHVAFTAAQPTASDQTEGAQRLIAEGVDITALPQPTVLRKRAHGVGYSPEFSRYIAESMTSFDIVHAHGPWTFPTLMAVHHAKRAGRPVVLTPHEGLTAYDLSHARTPGFRTVKAILKRYYLRNMAAIVFSSPLELRDSVGAERDRWQVIWHPVYDDRAASKGVSVRAASSDQEFRIGMLGRFHKKKNVRMMIELLANLPAAVKLHLAGTGDAETVAALHRCAEERGVAQRVRWSGFVVGTEKETFLREVDILAMPSEYECFGMAAVEALLMARPVLLSPSVGIAEFVTTHGIGFVVPNDHESIRRTVLSALADVGAFGAMGERARHAAHEHFSFQAHGSALAALYVRVLEMRGSKRQGVIETTDRGVVHAG